MPYRITSRRSYYEHVLNGGATTQKNRIMRLFLTAGRPITRNMVDRFFDPPNRAHAADGKSKIKWKSTTGHITHLVQDGYLRAATEFFLDGIGKCEVCHKNCEYLMPVSDRWEKRRLFDEQPADRNPTR